MVSAAVRCCMRCGVMVDIVHCGIAWYIILGCVVRCEMVMSIVWS